MRYRTDTRAGGTLRRGRIATSAAVLLLLVGCEGRFTADLATDAPADPQIAQLRVSLLGLEFRKDDGAAATLEFRSGELVDALDLSTGDPIRLFTSEQLSSGRYTGVRLLFDEGVDATVTTTGGDVFPVVLADGEFAAVDFTVQDDESSSESVTLTLDLRQSLDFDQVDDEYTLTPHLRAARTGEAAQITGSVNVTCPAGTSLILGGAVYLFADTDITPDDVDGAAPEPYATTAVLPDANSGQLTYALRFLAPGDYTIAPTCRGNEDEPVAGDELEFGEAGNVTVEASQVLQRNLTETPSVPRG